MDSEEIIEITAKWVREKLSDENSGHDWNHALAVWNNAKLIADSEENINRLEVELAALLHDVNDWKNKTGEDEKMVENFLKKVEVDENIIKNIMEITKKVSFLGPNFVEEKMSREGQIVRDADRLEAIGEVAWERTKQFGLAKGIPEINKFLPNLNLTNEEYINYKRKENSGINHLFESCLLFKNRLVTKKAKEIGQQKHEELKEVIRIYLESIRGKNLVPESRIDEYLKMLKNPRFN